MSDTSNADLVRDFDPGELQLLRIKMNLSWRELAVRLGVSESLLFHVNRGSRQFSRRTAARIRKLLPCDDSSNPTTSSVDRVRAIAWRQCADQLYVFAVHYSDHPKRNPGDNLNEALKGYEELCDADRM